ncbi:MAG: hypothetical protein ABI743_10275 [bacterium]
MRALQYLADETTISDMLTVLLSRDVTVNLAPRTFNPEDGVPACAAMYARETGGLAAIAICDIPLAAGLGCALAMIPATRASEVAKTAMVHADLHENLEEVLNVCSSLFREDPADGVTLIEVDYGPKLGDAYRLQARGVVYRYDFDIAIAGYGGGRLSLLALR